MAKEKELSDVLYGKKPKRNVSATVTSSHMKDIKDESNFDLGTLTQMESNSGTAVKGTVVKPPQVTVNPAVINFDRPIIVQPVVNLNSKDLSWNEKEKS